MSIRLAAVSLIVLAALTAQPASAGLFGKKDKTPDVAAAPAAPTTTLAQTTSQAEAFTPATKAEIEAALRADPLAQATFFNTQFSHNPTNPQIGLYLSNALRALGRYEEAADTAHRVLLFAPDNQDLLLAAARAHIADNNAFFAIDSLQHALELKPKNWQAWSLLGVAFDQTKRPEDAQNAWAKALQISPDNPVVLTNMAMAKVTRGDFVGAEPLLRTAAAQTGATMQVRQNLALVLGLQGKMPEAERLLRQDMPPAQADANLAWLQQAIATHPAATAPASATAPVRSWDSLKSSGS
ncbi:tetratricopeptide repeat protein [Asticcacaulis sp. 201]|uniref:tetratricopeptide repeat protein n=1 Tax=Asticcacaulis sp. 201 TaxID=3028787 RepID=UPI002916FFD4|nr:tetratricopeptide repeat protein [Asticcacaulis sp. 201]MDV6332145.1 pilus assembly protein TadD [Asticcacaulis sp. 201]